MYAIPWPKLVFLPLSHLLLPSVRTKHWRKEKVKITTHTWKLTTGTAANAESKFPCSQSWMGACLLQPLLLCACLEAVNVTVRSICAPPPLWQEFCAPGPWNPCLPSHEPLVKWGASGRQGCLRDKPSPSLQASPTCKQGKMQTDNMNRKIGHAWVTSNFKNRKGFNTGERKVTGESITHFWWIHLILWLIRLFQRDCFLIFAFKWK